MREIKFRAWHLKEKFMHSVGELSFRAGGIKWYGPGVGQGYWATADMPEVEVDSVLMQFTGLKDKNGVEIYEGDVLEPKYNGLRPFAVKFENGAFNAAKFAVESCWVIGNIYETPELLKD